MGEVATTELGHYHKYKVKIPFKILFTDLRGLTTTPPPILLTILVVRLLLRLSSICSFSSLRMFLTRTSVNSLNAAVLSLYLFCKEFAWMVTKIRLLNTDSLVPFMLFLNLKKYLRLCFLTSSSSSGIRCITFFSCSIFSSFSLKD